MVHPPQWDYPQRAFRARAPLLGILGHQAGLLILETPTEKFAIRYV